jgi:hypothetical protein
MGDAIAQVELALFQSLHLELVRPGRMLKSGNCGVEVAMLLLQARELILQLLLFFFRYFYQRLKRTSSPRRKTVPLRDGRLQAVEAGGLINAGIGALHNEIALRKTPLKV